MKPLAEHEVHLYYAEFTAEPVTGYLALLSPDEVERAARYRVEHARAQFIVTRGILRTLLGQYLDRPPAGISFHFGPQGKPEVAGSAGLAFSVSHSGNWSALAFARDCRLGIDIEHQRHIKEWEHIARNQFAASESAQVIAAPEHLRDALFFRFWTRREAYAKALGVGIGDPQTTAIPHDWFAYVLQPREDYAGTLVANKPVRVSVHSGLAE